MTNIQILTKELNKSEATLMIAMTAGERAEVINSWAKYCQAIKTKIEELKNEDLKNSHIVDAADAKGLDTCEGVNEKGIKEIGIRLNNTYMTYFEVYPSGMAFFSYSVHVATGRTNKNWKHGILKSERVRRYAGLNPLL